MSCRRWVLFIAMLLASGCSAGPAHSPEPSPAVQSPPATASAPTATSTAAGPRSFPTAVLSDGTVIHLEIAETQEERSRGLMFRPSLAEDRGMIFLFEQPGRLSIWMKNTWIPLDIVFLDERGTIVHIAENAQPCKAEPCAHYRSSTMASAVVELAAGTTERHGLEPGMTIRFENVAGYPIQTDPEAEQ